MASEVYLGLGSNIGGRLKAFQSAINYLKSDSQIKLQSLSSVYESKPFGYTEQDNFYNACLSLKTTKTIEDFFNFIKSIEAKIGRKKNFRNGPREIDLDILLFGDLILQNDYITIPHKDLLLRDFVLVPLTELNPDLIHPVKNKKISELQLESQLKYIIGKVKNNLIL